MLRALRVSLNVLMIGLDEYSLRKSLIEKAIDSGRFYLQFFKLFLSLYYFKRKDYLRAFEESENMIMQIYTDRDLDSRECIHRFLFGEELVAELDGSFKMGRFSRLTVV